MAVLKRLSSVSGGSFFEAQRTQFAESYAAIRQAIRRVWVADVACPSCRSDGRVYRLQLNLTTGGQVLSRGTDVRLLPLPGSASGEGSAQAAGEAAGAEGETRQDGGGPAGGSAAGAGGESEAESQDAVAWWQTVPWWLYALAAVLFVLLAWLVTRPPRPQDEEEVDDLDGRAPGSPAQEKGPKFTPSVPAQGLKEFPVVTATTGSVLKPRSLRLIVVRGSRKGKEYKVRFRERAVVGSRSTCDCVLGEEKGHCPGTIRSDPARTATATSRTSLPAAPPAWAATPSASLGA